jgi:hypothetical protein
MIFAALEVAGAIWLAVTFSGDIASEVVDIIDSLVVVGNFNATAIGSVLPDSNAVESIEAVQDSIANVPQETIDSVRDNAGGFGFALAAPGMFAFLFLLIAALCLPRAGSGSCCSYTMLTFHGVFCMWAWSDSIIVAILSFGIQYHEEFLEQRENMTIICEDTQAELRTTISNLTSAINLGRDHGVDVSELESSRTLAKELQYTVADLCDSLFSFFDSFTQLGSASIYGSIVYFAAFVVGCAGCCCLATVSTRKKAVPKMTETAGHQPTGKI